MVGIFWKPVPVKCAAYSYRLFFTSANSSAGYAARRGFGSAKVNLVIGFQK